MFGGRRCIRLRRRLRGEIENFYLCVVLLTCSSLDYLFQMAVEMRKLGLPWLSDIS